jgi:hypothetical protein
MRIDINGFPIISSSDIRWLDISVYLSSGIVVKVLKIEIDEATEWLKSKGYNKIEDSEGEVISLDPITYFYSDLFINNASHQIELIADTINKIKL